jgi:hypothetical protein
VAGYQHFGGPCYLCVCVHACVCVDNSEALGVDGRMILGMDLGN